VESVQQIKYAPVGAEFDAVLRDQLLDRRTRLERARERSGLEPDFTRLLDEVDDALARFDAGTYGLCETCGDPIEADRLIADPLQRFCLGDLTQKELSSIEYDLMLASEIQKGLLPKMDSLSDAGGVDFVYQPAGIVSGDYVDFIERDGELYFILGDVSGKGMAASILMSNLHAMFRALVPLGLPLNELMERANHLFCESTLANHYATLICGKLNNRGEVEFVNAGHLAPIIVNNEDCVALESAGLPLGMFCDSSFIASGAKIKPGETLLLFSDGVTEAIDHLGEEFGTQRLMDTLREALGFEPTALLDNCVKAVSTFRLDAERNDDLTMLALKYKGFA
jgi:sigma-B regulation protein RsbU (phosphoserine phosphatase)